MENKKGIVELIKYDYEGIAKVLSEFVRLYGVCENKELLDTCLNRFCSRPESLLIHEEI